DLSLLASCSHPFISISEWYTQNQLHVNSGRTDKETIRHDAWPFFVKQHDIAIGAWYWRFWPPVGLSDHDRNPQPIEIIVMTSMRSPVHTRSLQGCGRLGCTHPSPVPSACSRLRPRSSCVSPNCRH